MIFKALSIETGKIVEGRGVTQMNGSDDWVIFKHATFVCSMEWEIEDWEYIDINTLQITPEK